MLTKEFTIYQYSTQKVENSGLSPSQTCKGGFSGKKG